MASFLDLALVCQSLAQTQSRNQMADLVAEFLARLDPADAESAARFLIGRPLPQGDEKKLQVSGRAIWRIAAELGGCEDEGEEIFSAAEDFGEAVHMALRRRSPDPEPALALADVALAFADIGAIDGRNSRARKLAALRDLLARANALEGKYIAKILIREMRHGMSEGLLLEAIAKMAGRPVADVRRAHMLDGDVGRVARMMRSGEPAPSLAAAPLSRRPLKPMLAHPVADVAEAFAVLGSELALEHKLDGARVQIHAFPGAVRAFSRRLNEITPSLPEVVEWSRPLCPRSVILDGEVIAVGPDGRPHAFQELMRRFGRLRDIEQLRAEIPLALFLFDLLALDGALVIDRPYRERIAMLDELAAGAGLAVVGRIQPANLADGERFFAQAVAQGYEGVVGKALESRYTPGVRGRGWVKVKHVRTLDLVIVAAEWGYGRRHGWLSNYHLAARDDVRGGFATIGKTFKGLTDEQFEAMTERLLALKLAESRGVVVVRPEVVVEVGFNDIQRSPQYESGMALRFARILRIRDDKSPADADTLAAVAAEFERQLVKPVADRL